MSSNHEFSRRKWMQQTGGLLAAGWALHHRLPLFGDEDASRLIVRQAKPFNAEPALPDLLTDWITPFGKFFQRNHGTIPDIKPDDFKVTVNGLVEKPRTFSWAELIKRFPTKTVTATITCAGNRRAEFPPEPKVGGVQWAGAAIGNAEWGGAQLAEVLKFVGVKAEAKHVWFDGLDEITEGGKTFSFGASIPLDKAMNLTDSGSSCLLVHQMNKAPLPREHGGPLRGVIPGYIGARSVKWLGKITVSDRPSPNHYVAEAYKIVTETTPEAWDAASPLYEHALNSMTCGFSLNKDKMELKAHGFALPSGEAGCLIQRVDVSVDGGQSWRPTKLTSPQREFCWAFWEAMLPASAAGKTLLVRATDTGGKTQPREFPYNAKGYQYNAWHDVKLEV